LKLADNIVKEYDVNKPYPPPTLLDRAALQIRELSAD